MGEDVCGWFNIEPGVVLVGLWRSGEGENHEDSALLRVVVVLVGTVVQDDGRSDE